MKIQTLGSLSYELHNEGATFALGYFLRLDLHAACRSVS